MNLFKWCVTCLILLTYSLASLSQVTISPSNASGNDLATIIFDATGTPLAAETSVYAHAGVVITNTGVPKGSDWTNVKGNWGKDDGVGKMTAVSGQPNKWQFSFAPTLRQYFGVQDGTNIFWLSLVFRNATGSKQTSPDFFLKLTLPDFITILKPDPLENLIFIESGGAITISAQTSTIANSIEVFVDSGSGFSSIGSTTNSSSYQINYFPTQPGNLSIKAKATFNSSTNEAVANYSIAYRGPTIIADLPPGIKDGINYSIDKTKATLVLLAPMKQFVYLVGDFNNWQLDDNYLMKQTSDGKRFWIELTGLEPGKEYVFQYWVEGTIKIGDPLADKVSDPFNDSAIPTSTYPNLPPNSRAENGIATILQTGQLPFNWSDNEANYTPPAKDELLIYELLLRDFIGSRRYNDLADSLNYFKRLGINTIELMPIIEFEGNLSWGYNPSYFMAPDKIYGTKNDLKTLIDKAHQKGIAIVLDIALNHAFGQNAMVKMYWDKANNKPSSDNPWFNQDATHPFNVGYDFNHESLYTKAFVDTVTSYWLKEYHVDGFRFDLSKGFTQKNSGGDVNAWGAYDQSRVDIWDRISKKIFSVNPKAIIILEHFAVDSEEFTLSTKGMVLWRNLNYDFREVLKGNTTQSFGDGLAKTHVSYMESHDEERTAFDMITNGQSGEGYSIKNISTMLDRMKMAASFLYTLPGSKMLWQFQELGYDKSINTCADGSINNNCRLDTKPLVWGSGGLNYISDHDRHLLFETFSAINNLVNTNKDVFKNGLTTWKASGDARVINIKHSLMDVVIIGNFAKAKSNAQPNFSKTGTWFDFFTGESISITNTTAEIPLTPGEFHIYTTIKQPTPKAGLVTSIPKEQRENFTIVYPNPASAQLFLSVSDDYHGDLSISLVDLPGQEIRQQSLEYNGEPIELNIEGLDKGLYFLKTKVNGKEIILKILIQNP